MNKRTAAAALALLPLTIGIAACDPAAGTTASGTATATTAGTSGTGDSDASPSCTAVYPDMYGTGITLSGGKVTGAMTLTCDPVPAPGAALTVSIALFYRPNTSVGTTYLPGSDASTYQDEYTATAPCEPGLWYLGSAIDGTPVKGQVVDITDCSQGID
jgi:hypothetical protein